MAGTSGCSNTVTFTTGHNITISGPFTICTSANYTANNVPTGKTITWETSSNLSNPSSGNSATISKTGSDGTGYVSVKYNNVELTRLNVWVGVISLTSTSITGPFETTTGTYTTFSVSLPYGSDISYTGYQWTVDPNVSTKIIGANSDRVSIDFDQPGYYTVHCKISNACGWGSDYYAPVYVYNHKSYTVPHPNPVSDVLFLSFDSEMVEATKTSLQTSGSTRQSFLLDIKLLDNFGIVCRQTTSTGEKIQFDVSGLSNGMYFLQVHDGITAAPEMHKIIINH